MTSAAEQTRRCGGFTLIEMIVVLAILALAIGLVVPLFGLARLLGPPQAVYRLAGLGLTLPGVMLFVPTSDQVLMLALAMALEREGHARPWAHPRRSERIAPEGLDTGVSSGLPPGQRGQKKKKQA